LLNLINRNLFHARLARQASTVGVPPIQAADQSLQMHAVHGRSRGILRHPLCLSTAAKHGIGKLDALTRAASGPSTGIRNGMTG
jgi:hypothetical protein